MNSVLAVICVMFAFVLDPKSGFHEEPLCISATAITVKNGGVSTIKPKALTGVMCSVISDGVNPTETHESVTKAICQTPWHRYILTSSLRLTIQ